MSDESTLPVGQVIGATSFGSLASSISSTTRKDSITSVALNTNSAQPGGSLPASLPTEGAATGSQVNSVSPVAPTRTDPLGASLAGETKSMDHAQSGIPSVAAREVDNPDNQTTNLYSSENGVDSVNGVLATSATKKPSIAIPRMTRLDSGAPSSKHSSPLNPSAISRRSSKYGSGVDSQRNSRRQSKALSSYSSVTSLRSHRPAPPSPASSLPSRHHSQTTQRLHSRHESNDSESSSNPTERFPSHKPSTSSMRQSFSNLDASGSLTVDNSGTQSTLVITFSHTKDGSQKSPVDGKPLMSSPLSLAQGTTPGREMSTQSTTASLSNQKLAPLSASHSHIRRNFSSTSASTSGSSSSVPSNPAAKHANELAEAYASMGIYMPMAGTPAAICDEHGAVTNEPPAVDESDLQWHRSHPIVVRDFAYDESDELFSARPVELMMRSDRPPFHHSRSYEWQRNQPRFSAGGGVYSSGVHYGAPWGGDFDEDEDDWGFPMGSISDGTNTTPMGNTGGGGSSNEPKSRSRTWGTQRSNSFGTKWVDVSEEESSNYYEESGEDDEFEEISPQPRYEDDYDGEDVHTPSRTFKQPPLHGTHAQPELDGQDGIDGDDDFSSGDELGYDEANPPILKTGVYRALYAFDAEGPTEMSISINQLVRIIGRGGGEGWAVALRDWTPEQEIKGTRITPDGGEHADTQGLVPEGYLELYQLDERNDE